MTTSNPFELLGLPLHFDLRKSDLDTRLRDLSKVLHPDRHAGSAPDRRVALNRAIAMNEAVRTLRDPVARGYALLGVLRPSVHVDEARVDQLFLFELMELREQLATAQKDTDWAKVRVLGEQAQSAWNESVTNLTQKFAALANYGDSSNAHEVTTQILGELAKLKYWQRLIEEVGRIEAEQD